MVTELNNTLNFDYSLKLFQQEGDLVYEYNPLHNYRLNEDMIYYKQQLWRLEDFDVNLSGGVKYNSEQRCFGIIQDKVFTPIESWIDSNGNPYYSKTEEAPIFYQKGSIIDFETDELDFDLNNPVNILPQYSYDNSVNLILNDGKNPPRLINTRFAVTKRNKYQICNRLNSVDTNIYDQGEQFDIDTSLYKKTSNIAEVTFLGVFYGGQLSIGNYHFYFKYVDGDGNESDFFQETGMVSIFIGNSANSIYSGFRDQNSSKLVKFRIQSADPAYNKILVYFTRATSDIFENRIVNAYKINTSYSISESQDALILITGQEDISQVDISEINPLYQQYGSVETQVSAQNRLFLGNLDRVKLNYEDLADCALRFLPVVTTKQYNIESLDYNYSNLIQNTYQDSDFIYNYTGYYPEEIYRLGVVFIFKDKTLSNVFNIRGIENLPDSVDAYKTYDFENAESRNYIQIDSNYNLIGGNGGQQLRENSKGVIKFNSYQMDKILGINIFIESEVLNHLKNELNVSGLMFVRQKRIPTTLCQAYLIGVDKQSHIPVIPCNEENKYLAEGFLTSQKILDHYYGDRYYKENKYEVSPAMLCPEYDINSSYLNTLFNGQQFVAYLQERCTVNKLLYNHFAVRPTITPLEELVSINIIGVEDNVKLVSIGENLFSARAGEAEDATKYEYFRQENKSKDATNLLRGAYGPYLGISGIDVQGTCDLYTIKIPGYQKSNIDTYFSIRMQDESPFYPISYRMSIENTSKYFTKQRDYYSLNDPLYRGDCYICRFTHRVNRNFQDPSAPINDKIVDPNCWKNNYDIEDGIVKTDKFEKINLGDLNAVTQGLYMTMFVRSTFNLNVRSIDESNVDEMGLVGHPRGFYPYFAMSNDGPYKVPEALCYNKGFETSLSEKTFFVYPEVPWIKNEFSNRIAYSEIQIKDAFNNGFRTFKGASYRDYPKTYGSITKLIELSGNLLCVFEHGVCLIPVNERTVAGEGSGGNVYINTANVLPENPKVISDTFGSQWRESVIKTDLWVYGVDTVGKKIWRTDGSKFECISDFSVQEFLNNNISLTERELEPIIGVRNVKTHFNRFKNDVMFTFYDNLYGFEEKVWNLCYNELLGKWITFYSWVPSYSENIDNIFFSFDRNTSKWIAKLGTSVAGSSFADGVVMEDNVIKDSSWSTKLSLANRTLPSGDDISSNIEYIQERDNYGNHNRFHIIKDGSDYILKLSDGVTYESLCSELYIREYTIGNKTYLLDNPGSDDKTAINKNTKIREALPNDKSQKDVYSLDLKIYKDDNGRRVNLDKDNQINGNQLVYYLNIRANITANYTGQTSLAEAYVQGFSNKVEMDAGYYQSVVAVIPEYNMQFLTTDFWKHGQAGIFDIKDPILPSYWYGRQHSFEFEFIVANNPDKHKIFDSLEIISNKAKPKSFHYEVVGNSYEFAKDKKNMYIRQEALKELYQYNGEDIVYDYDYTKLDSDVPRQINANSPYYEKSTMFPQYYYRKDTINEIEDSYHLMTDSNKDFSQMAGAEVVKYPYEYRIRNNVMAVDLNDKGRLKGNMQYKEDKWDVQINPINLVQHNETIDEWREKYSETDPNKLSAPVVHNLFAMPNYPNELELPKDWTKNIISWGDLESLNKEAKLKDKYIKIRIRYKGNELAIISAINTLYSISYA